MKAEYKEIIKKIDPSKFYSIRETATFLPWIKCEPTLQKLINEDHKNNDNKVYKAIILKRKTNNRYYIKGENIIKLLEEHVEEK